MHRVFELFCSLKSRPTSPKAKITIYVTFRAFLASMVSRRALRCYVLRCVRLVWYRVGLSNAMFYGVCAWSGIARALECYVLRCVRSRGANYIDKMPSVVSRGADVLDEKHSLVSRGLSNAMFYGVCALAVQILSIKCLVLYRAGLIYSMKSLVLYRAGSQMLCFTVFWLPRCKFSR